MSDLQFSALVECILSATSDYAHCKNLLSISNDSAGEFSGLLGVAIGIHVAYLIIDRFRYRKKITDLARRIMNNLGDLPGPIFEHNDYKFLRILADRPKIHGNWPEQELKEIGGGWLYTFVGRTLPIRFTPTPTRARRGANRI